MSLLGEQHIKEFAAAVGLYELEIESVSLPMDGVRINGTGHTTYAIIVKIRGDERWVVRKRYSEMRGFHTDLKSSHAQVKQLTFPSKFVMPSSTFQEKRRRGLDEYFRALLNVGPLVHHDLVSFFDVNANVEEFERMQRATPSEVEYDWTEIVLRESSEDESHADSDESLEFTSRGSINSSTGHPPSVDESPLSASCTKDPDDL